MTMKRLLLALAAACALAAENKDKLTEAELLALENARLKAAVAQMQQNIGQLQGMLAQYEDAALRSKACEARGIKLAECEIDGATVRRKAAK